MKTKEELLVLLIEECGEVIQKEIVDLFRKTKMDSVYDFDKKLGDIFEV